MQDQFVRSTSSWQYGVRVKFVFEHRRYIGAILIDSGSSTVLATCSGSSTMPATGRLVGISARGLSVRAAVRCKRRVRGSRERGST